MMRTITIEQNDNISVYSINESPNEWANTLSVSDEFIKTYNDVMNEFKQMQDQLHKLVNTQNVNGTINVTINGKRIL